MTQSINVKSSSLSKSTNFYRNHPSEFCLGEKEMLDSESSIRYVHWRGLCSWQRVEQHPNANCLLLMLYITGAHKTLNISQRPQRTAQSLINMSRKLHHEQTTSELIHASVLQFNVVHKRNPAGTGTDLQGIRMDLIPLNPAVIHNAQQTKGLTWQQFHTLRSRLSK